MFRLSEIKQSQLQTQQIGCTLLTPSLHTIPAELKGLQLESVSEGNVSVTIRIGGWAWEAACLLWRRSALWLFSPLRRGARCPAKRQLAETSVKSPFFIIITHNYKASVHSVCLPPGPPLERPIKEGEGAVGRGDEKGGTWGKTHRHFWVWGSMSLKTERKNVKKNGYVFA